MQYATFKFSKGRKFFQNLYGKTIINFKIKSYLFRYHWQLTLSTFRPRMHPEQGVYAKFWLGWICSLCDAGLMWLICGGPTRCVQPENTLGFFFDSQPKTLTLSSSVTIHCHCHACMHAWHRWAQPRGSCSNGWVRRVQISRAINGSTASSYTLSL